MQAVQGWGLASLRTLDCIQAKAWTILPVAHTDGNTLVEVARRSQPNHRGFVGFVVNISVLSEDAADVFVLMVGVYSTQRGNKGLCTMVLSQ